MRFQNTVGHKRIKEQLSRAIDSGKLGHAYLFSGEGGIGKFPLALDLAQIYLCKSDNKPCGECENCKGIKKYANPHFQFIFPLKVDADMRKSEDFTEKGWEYINEKTIERIDEPYSMTTDYSAAVYVNRIRDVNEMIVNNRGKKTVTIIDGIDTISDISLNTILKTLEEPPAEALIILLARFSVLPTIRSRCVVYKFGTPQSEEVKDWLKSKVPEKSEREISYIAEISQNIPGIALAKLSEHGEKTQELASRFTDIVFSKESEFEKFMSLDKFVFELGRNFDLAQRILVYLLTQIRSGFLYAANFSQRKPEIYIPNFKNFEQATTYCDVIGNSILSIKRNSPLNMVFVDLTINLTEIFNGRK
jgi:DNA polymerase III delta prime subunit